MIMQYILTEEEYNNLVSKSKVEELKSKIERLNQKVLEYSKYTCRHEVRVFGYCDDCPIQISCNKPKNYSK